MSNWLNYTGNLPTVAVNELEIEYSSSRLRVATYGRGVWDVPLFVAGVVPVKWLSFKASRLGNGVQLQWKVANETSRTKYELLRSTDGLNFISLAVVPARGQPTADYSYMDVSVPGGMLFYRLKEIEDGRTAYSNIISIRGDDKTSVLQINPNPVTDGLLHFGFLNSQGQQFELNIVADDGRIMMVHRQTDGVGTLNISNLPAGVYNLLVKQGNGLYKARFVKGK